MKQILFSQRLRYWFDNYMSKGTAALIGGLGVLSLVIILLAGAIIALGQNALAPEGSPPLPFREAAWAALMRTLDAGTMGGDAGWGFRFVMFLVTLGGVFIISSLIGVLTSGVEAKMDELRKGRSRIIESGHTVILGWSSQVFAIIPELVTANANQPRSCIAILADMDKVEMEDQIRSRVGATGKTRIVCRTGSPLDLTELEIISPHTAKSIIILAPETEEADSHTIKAILALTNNPHRRPQPYHIVAEVRNPKNIEAARLVGKDEAELVLVDELIARITAQTCRQSGLSVVYTELLDFGGDEIYLKAEPALNGKTFGEAMLAYEDSTVIGLHLRDGRTLVHPPKDTLLQNGDKIIAIAEDDDTIRLSGLTDYHINFAAISQPAKGVALPEQTLILGWNRRAPRIIKELDHYVASGSAVTVVASTPEAEAELACDCEHLEHQKVIFKQGDTTDRQTLEELDVSAYNHVITLSYSDDLGDEEADARTLVTLLHLRDMADKAHRDFAIVSEMLDVRNRDLAEVTRADDFIVSDKLVSLMMSQLSENKLLAPVIQDLFDPEGSELYLKPAGEYVALGTPVNFYTVVESARQKNEVAIGYRLRAEASHPQQPYGVAVNPEKSKLVTFAAQDRIIVLAEE
jgi:voltage-gated potassium channel Kch